MKIYYKLLILNFLECVFCCNQVIIQPSDEYHYHNSSLIVQCDASSQTDNVIMLYSYKSKNYTIQRLPPLSGGLFKGNLFVPNEASIINVLCLDTIKYCVYGVKYYEFGYSPRQIFSDKPKLTCRDLNFITVLCCISPSIANMQMLTKFQLRSGNFSLRMYDTSDYKSEYKSSTAIGNESCFHRVVLFLPTLSVSVDISNVLGNVTFNYEFDRANIVKPNPPSVELKCKDENIIEAIISMSPMAEYRILVLCQSNYPIRLKKEVEFDLFSQKIIKDISGWKPNSVVYCSSRSKIDSKFRVFSDFSNNTIQMKESYPDSGPILHPGLIQYESIYNRNLYNARIYYMDVPVVSQNGEIIYYKWKCTSCHYDSDSTNKDAKILENDERMVFLKKIAISSLFEITACTKVGCSKKWSRISVFELTATWSYRMFATDVLNDPTRILLSWFIDESLMAKRRYVQPFIIICYWKKRSDDCISIRKISLPLSRNGTEMVDVERPIRMKFALIINNQQHYGPQFQWIQCIYKSFQPYVYSEIGKMINKTAYISESFQCSYFECHLYISIKRPQCEKFSQFFIFGYAVEYNNHILKQESLWSDEFVFPISGLKTGHRVFNFTISILLNGNTSKIWTTYQFTTPFWTWYYILIFVTVAILFFVALLCSFRRCYRKIMEKFKSQQYVNRVVKRTEEVKDRKMYNAEEVTDSCIIEHNAQNNQCFDEQVPSASDSSNSSETYNNTETTCSGTNNSNNTSEILVNIEDDSYNTTGNYIARPDLYGYAFTAKNHHQKSLSLSPRIPIPSQRLSEEFV